MPEELRLRPATPGDAAILLEWRNDSHTRVASHNTEAVERDDYLKWFASSLDNKNRILLVAEEDGVSVGTVRADLIDGIHELSWTVAPSARGRGVGKRMVALFAREFPGTVRAEVKKGNDASARIAKFAGMKLEKEENGVLHYKRISGAHSPVDSN